MFYLSSVVSLATAATLAVTVVNVGQAQVRTAVPTARIPVMTPLQPTATPTALAAYQVVVWSNARPAALAPVSNVTGPVGTGLPSAAQIRAAGPTAVMLTQPNRAVSMQISAATQAAQLLSRMGQCSQPACAVEIDQLGPCGQVVQSDYFSTSATHVQAIAPGVDQVQLFFQQITSLQHNQGGVTHQDDWAAPN